MHGSIGLAEALVATASGLPMLAYLGPETIMPMTSLLAAVIGFLLLAWQRVVHWVVAPFVFFGLVRREADPAAPPATTPPPTAGDPPATTPDGGV